MKEYVAGRLSEDGQQFDLPIIVNGEQKPFFRAGYHIHKVGQPSREYQHSKNLTYLAVPTKTKLHFQSRNIPIPFRDKTGEKKDLQMFSMSSFSIRTHGRTTLAKIHPYVMFRVQAEDGTPYHSFEWLDTPEDYKPANEEHFDPVYTDEKKGLNVMERGSRVIRLPGVTIYPEFCAFRIPGWQAKEFNGSPEFGFAYSPFEEPRKEEALHLHKHIFEPQIGLSGNMGLFVGIDDGSEKITITDVDGPERDVRGEIVEIKKGDIVITMPHAPPHIIVRSVPDSVHNLYNKLCPPGTGQSSRRRPCGPREREIIDSFFFL